MSTATGGSSAVGSLSVDTEMLFNLAHEHDALALLRCVHYSTLSLDLKNYLRDLVFSTRFGEVVPVTAAFAATFAAHGFKVFYEPTTESRVPDTSVTPAPTAAAVRTEAKSVGFGFQRSTPAFTAPKIPVSETPSKTIPVVAPLPTPAPVAEPVVPVKTVPEPEPVVVAPVSEVVPTPSPTQSATAVPVVEDVVLTDDPIPKAPAAPSVASTTETATTDSPANRIAAIKHEVNALVGNPVVLIDVHNEVGREYMNALLDAMKKSLGGTPEQEVLRAMARLERAFEAVKKVLSEAPAVPPVEDGVSDTPLKTTPLDDNRWNAATPEPEVATPTAIPEVVPEPADPEPAVLAISPTPDTSAVHLPSVADVVAMPETSVSTDVPRATQLAEEPPTPVVPVSELPTADAVEVTEVVMPVSTAMTQESSEVITSVAKEKQLRELMEARHVAEAEASAKRAEINAHNPLMADDVSRGLTQLLSEWKLFKSSGIFGTGPSGHEHPLYKKLAPLTMAAVLAGRFDGATPEIKRSITDYMNGWRYEEGVMHEVGESFENYLRRVIRHILDK